MIGDEQLPPENAHREGGERGIVSTPDWYMSGAEKPPGGRVTFATWRFFDREEPLQSSGLLGPARAWNPREIVFEN